jgi:type II secretory pathway component PulF
MLIRLTPGKDEKAALALDDLASQLDAGLSPQQVGGNPADGERVLVTLLTGRGVGLDAVDEAILVASWRAGRAVASLKRLADQRRTRAVFTRSFLGSVRYPLVLIVMAVGIAMLCGSVMHKRWLPIVAAAVPAAGVAGVIVLLRGLRNGGRGWMTVPIVGAWARDVAELPYLEILHGLYASGVPLLQAHPEAVAACPVRVVREGLRAADSRLQQGNPLHESLLTAAAVDPETLHLLGNGERTGNLEEALQRALTRRRDVVQRRTALLAGTLGRGAYLFAVLLAAAAVLTFYTGYFDALGLHHR